MHILRRLQKRRAHADQRVDPFESLIAAADWEDGSHALAERDRELSRLNAQGAAEVLDGRRVTMTYDEERGSLLVDTGTDWVSVAASDMHSARQMADMSYLESTTVIARAIGHELWVQAHSASWIYSVRGVCTLPVTR